MFKKSVTMLLLVGYFFVFFYVTVSGVTEDPLTDVRTIAANLLNMQSDTEIPPLVLDLLNGLPKDVKDVLKVSPLYELSKEQLVTIPVPLLYLLPKHQLNNLSGYQHGMLLRLRPDILSLADLVVNSMEEPDVKDPFLRSLQYARNLSGPVQDEMGRSMAEWKRTEIEFEKMYSPGNPLAVHMPLSFMLEMSSKLKSEMMFFLRTWLWEDYPYRGANIVNWLSHPPSVRRVFTKLCIDDNYPVPLKEWKYNHIEAFSHILPTMTLSEFLQINLNEKFNTQRLLRAPLNTLQIRYLFETLYPADQLQYPEFQEVSHILSSLQPVHLNKFLLNSTDMIHAQYHLNNITFATAKQIAEIIKVQTKWSDPEATDKTVLSNIGSFLYTLPTAEIAKLDASNIDADLLKRMDSNKLIFPQAYVLGMKANVSLLTNYYKNLPQAMPAESIHMSEVKVIPTKDLVNLLHGYPGTHEAFSATLMSRLGQTLDKHHLESILLNPARNKLLKYLPVQNVPGKIYSQLSQLYEQPRYRKLIDQVDDSLIRTLMPAEVSHKMYIKDRFLFKGMTCAHISNINAYELVVFTQDYFNYIRQTNQAIRLTRQTMNCWFKLLNTYLKMKPFLSLLKTTNENGGVESGERVSQNRIDQMSPHELRAFGNVAILYKTEVIASSEHLERIVEMNGRMPREFLWNMQTEDGYDLILRKYFEKTLNASNKIGIHELLAVGNVTHFLPTDLIRKIDPKAFKLLVETELIDSRLCGNTEYMLQIEELILRAFGHVSTWTPDILVILKDFLLALSEDQMKQIPEKSWSAMADLIETDYVAKTYDEYGLNRPFYRMCMAQLNERESQDYFQSLSRLTKFYLVKVQFHLDSVKSVTDIISHQHQLAMNVVSKEPDDEMKIHTVFEPDEVFDEDAAMDSTTEATTTETTTDKRAEDSTESSGEIIGIEAHNITTSGSEFNFWDVWARPKETTTGLSVDKEILTTSTTKLNSNSILERNKLSGTLSESLEKSEEAFIATISEENEDLEQESAEIGNEDNKLVVRREDPMEGDGRFNEKKTPCGNGSCVASTGMERRNTTEQMEEETNSVDTPSTTLRVEKYDPVGEEDINPQVLDHIIDIHRESPGGYHTTKSSLVATYQEVDRKEKALEYEQSLDVTVNDLNKWNEHHEDNHQQNELHINASIQTSDLAEKSRHKKENKIENYSENTTLTRTSEITTHNPHKDLTYEDEELHRLISKMPTVPSEEPKNRENLESSITQNNHADLLEDDFIIKSEDRDIMERVHSESRATVNESEVNDTVEETTKIQVTTSFTTKEMDIDNQPKIIPTEFSEDTKDKDDANRDSPMSTITYTTNPMVYHENQNDSNSWNTHKAYDSTVKNIKSETNEERHETDINNENNLNESRKEVNGQIRDDEQYSGNPRKNKHRNYSNRDPNQYQNKLTDELDTSSYESNNDDTNDNYHSRNRYNDENNDYSNEINNNYNDVREHNEDKDYGSDQYDNYKNSKYNTKDLFNEDQSLESDPKRFNKYPSESNEEHQSEPKARGPDEEDGNNGLIQFDTNSKENTEKRTNEDERSNKYPNKSNEEKEQSTTNDREQNKEYGNKASDHTDDYTNVEEHNDNSFNKDKWSNNESIETKKFTNESNEEHSKNYENNTNNNPLLSNHNFTDSKKGKIQEIISVLNKGDKNDNEETDIKQNVSTADLSTTQITTSVPMSIIIEDSTASSEFKDSELNIIPFETTSSTNEIATTEKSSTIESSTMEDSNKAQIKEENNIILNNVNLRDSNKVKKDTDSTPNLEEDKSFSNKNKETKVKIQEKIETSTTLEIKQYEERTPGSMIHRISNKVQDLFTSSEEVNNILTSTSQNVSQNNVEETSTLPSISEIELKTLRTIEMMKGQLPGNYKHTDLVSLIIDQEMKETEADRKAFNSRMAPDTLVVYDVPEDISPEDIGAIEDANGKDYMKSRYSAEDFDKTLGPRIKNNYEANEAVTSTTEEETNNAKLDHSSAPMPQNTSELEQIMKDYNKELDPVVLEVIDEPININEDQKIKSSRRRRRFVMNQDHNLDPSNMQITCEALNMLGTISQITNLENTIAKLNKDAILDCMDLINKVSVSKITQDYIISKNYKDRDQVLPLLGNTLADLSLEDIRGIKLNEWSLEILEHMNSINDSKKAELIVDKYLKRMNRAVLDTNEMDILNNMICYLPEKLLRSSTVNIQPAELLSILKDINTCSEKCLNLFSSIAVSILGNPSSWKYEQVYNLGTIPSGLNETMWQEFLVQTHLKYNLNENNYRCFNKNQMSAVFHAVLEDLDQIEAIEAPEVQDEGYSSSSKMGSGSVGMIVYLVLFVKLVL